VEEVLVSVPQNEGDSTIVNRAPFFVEVRAVDDDRLADSELGGESTTWSPLESW
jgi:hypothetical protein